MAINPEVIPSNVKLKKTPINTKTFFGKNSGGGKGGALVPSKGGSLRAKGGTLSTDKLLNTHDPLEQRVANNEKKISSIKRILQTHLTPYGGSEDSLDSIASILEDIGKALAVDFTHRITQTQNQISGLRAGADKSKRENAEGGLEAVKKMSSSVGKTLDKVTLPAKNILQRVLDFFGALAVGFVADKGLTWLSNNQHIVTGFFNFLADHGKKILIGLGVLLGVHIMGKVVKKIRQFIAFCKGVIKFIKFSLKVIKNALRIARMILKFGPKALMALGKKFLPGIFKGGKVATKVGTETAKKVVTKKVTQTVAKKGATVVAKKIPLIGLGLGAAFAIGRARSGDWTGALMELGAGAASTIPGWGTAAAIAIEGGLIYRDIQRSNQKSGGGNDLESSSIDDYEKVVNTATKMDFSNKVTPTSPNLQPVNKNQTVVMDPVKLGSQNNLPSTSNASGGDSMPLVDSEDMNNSSIQYTAEHLGISNN